MIGIMTTLGDGEVSAAEAADAATREPLAGAQAEPTRPTASVRVALLLGFAAVFALWLVWEYQLVQNLRHTENIVDNLQRSDVRGEQTLSRVRTNVLLGSIYLCDALIDSTPARREYCRDELNRLRGEIDTLLAAYVRDVPGIVAP